MHRGGPSPLVKSQLFRLPSKHSTGRTARPDTGFRSVDLTHEGRMFMPNDPRMSVIRLFTPEGEQLPQETPYGPFIIRAMQRQIAFEILPRQQRMASHINPTTLQEAQKTAAQHMNTKLITTRQAPFYIVIREAMSQALFAAELRSVELAAGRLIPYMADRNGDLGILPPGFTFDQKPLAQRAAIAHR